MWLECVFNRCRYFVACCYHPPKPRYDNKLFIEVLLKDIDNINGSFCDAIIIVCGDFNQLNTAFLEIDHGLVQIVTSPTHCGHLIDKVLVSRPDIYQCRVY